MSTSMVSTVLEIEREAEAVLAKAKADAERLLTGAEDERKSASIAYAADIKRQAGEIEAAANAEREVKIRELSAAGQSALSAVRTVSDAAFDSGVSFVMDALSGK